MAEPQLQPGTEPTPPPQTPTAVTEVVTPPSLVSDLPQEVQTLIRENGKEVILQSNAFTKLKNAAVEKGRKQALADMARAHGFPSVEALELALKNSRQPTAPASTQVQSAPAQTRTQESPVAKPQSNDNKISQRLMRENEELKKQNRKIANQLKQKDRLSKAAETRALLTRLAAEKGIKHPEYALIEWQKEVENLSSEALDQFDHGAFFDGLRATKPFLFGEVTASVMPATTGTGIGRPTAPSPVAVAKAAAEAGKIDAMKMTASEFSDYKRRMGISA